MLRPPAVEGGAARPVTLSTSSLSNRLKEITADHVDSVLPSFDESVPYIILSYARTFIAFNVVIVFIVPYH